ncbi:hypothetical protein TVAG_363940 [Trichomonas vaginalis G3]|uniref:DUF3447 domain-containing protein n=1 Tax=Trichomonas vaginalis (strain ATCC PRA-98 / G3) TaxID=412133 RepID=A2EDW3_TRIV3|nr:hypothetical protein TVAG_363940 [Trichomonas vaginalis G3]|eukprot:XP_001321402.1 hypothetical protein [Trichomonas vaginalis G3]
MEIFKAHHDTYDALYKLNSNDPQEIENLFNLIKSNMSKPELITAQNLLSSIGVLFSYKNHYLRGYLLLFKKIYEEFQPKRIINVPRILHYFLYKEYGIVIDEAIKNSFKKLESKNYSLEVHEENTILRAIMDDDVESFISFTERSGFDENFIMKNNDLYPYLECGYSYLDLCCFHGSVKCFKFFGTKFGFDIAEDTVSLSFLSGNPDIMFECLKVKKPDFWAMKYAVFTHNMDFVAFLMNEYKIDIDLCSCARFNNIQAFLAYLDQTHDYNKCYAHSPGFNIPFLCKYLLSNGAKIGSREEKLSPAHYAALTNAVDALEYLISIGESVNYCSYMDGAPIHFAAEYNGKEFIKILLDNNVNVNEKGNACKIPLILAADEGCLETVEFLIANGANINASDNEGKTALHYAAESDFPEVIELLRLHQHDKKYSKF